MNNHEFLLLEFLSKGRRSSSKTHSSTAGSKRLSLPHCSPSNSSSAPSYQRSVADMLHTAMKKPQAIVKITSFNKGIRKVKAHVGYISRKGELALEDENGQLIKKRENQEEVINTWALRFGTHKRSRDTLNMVLSAPPGSSRERLEQASREFLQEHFSKQHHDYLFVPHHDTAHPHVHAVITMVSNHGHRLNPRKAYLQQLRNDFAKLCRQQGIDVEASPRCERGLAGSSKSSACLRIKRRKQLPRVDQRLLSQIKQEYFHSGPPHPSIAKIQKRNYLIRKRYAETAQKLNKKAIKLSNFKHKEKYQQAAQLLMHHAQTLPMEKNRGKKLHQQIDQQINFSASTPSPIRSTSHFEYEID